MREIDNRVGKIQQAELKTDKQEIVETKKIEASEDKKVVTDFSNPKAEALGRSQVKTDTDNLKNDIAFLSAYPDSVDSAEKFFKVTYAKLLKEDSPNAYEKASAMATIYAKEIATKQ